MVKKILGLDLTQENIQDGLDVKVNKVSKKDIAIIGASARLPFADDISELWENIIRGVDCIAQIPENRRIDLEKYLRFKNINPDDVEFNEEAYIENIDMFDYSFFRISPKEAGLMDPNQRLFLEEAWHAIEDAGYGGDKLSGTKTGVFMGYFQRENFYYNLISEVDPASKSMAFPGNLPSIIASRISYYLNLKGTSMIIDTSCSSSLVALHTACKYIRSGECEQALVGSIKINFMSLRTDENIEIASSDGRTRTFDNDSEGTNAGEGVIALLLKPLGKALEDRDNIYAVIKGGATNQDGASIGITAPNVLSQEEVIVSAWRDAGVDPETIGYIEAHGTGTKLGDPIEVEAVTRAFRKYTDKKQFCGIGSIKTNMGHLDQAAGIAGLLKAVLALKHKKIPPMIHFEKPNVKISFEDSPVYVSDRAADWKTDKTPRRCGVSAFGMSGTNCHIVLEEAPPYENSNTSGKDLIHVLAISAKSIEVLKNLVNSYKTFLEGQTNICVEDLCFTANTGRGHYSHRIAVVFEKLEDLKHKIGILSKCDYDKSSLDSIEGVYFGEHRLVSGKSNKASGEVSDSDIRTLTGEADAVIDSLVTSKVKAADLMADICRLYTGGARINWDSIYEGQQRRRISIPKYPFERKKCFVSIPENKAFLPSARQAMYYRTGWVPAVQEKGNIPAQKGTVLLLASENNLLNKSLAENFCAKGLKVVTATAGADFERLDDSNYIFSGSLEHFDRLIKTVKGVTKIVHLMSLAPDSRISGVEELDKCLESGVYSLFYLAKAIYNNKLDNAELFIASDFVNEVSGTEKTINAHNAALFGLGKVLGLDLPGITCRLLDIDEPANVEQIGAEILSGSKEYQVAYREGSRFVEEIQEVDLPALNDSGAGFKDGGVYIIAGGFGKIGLEMARHIAAKNKVKLALVGRSDFPDRNQWRSIIDKKDNNSYQHKINTLLEIEKTGSEVICIKGNISDEKSVQELIEKLRSDYGKIDGVIQCAGVGVGKEGELIYQQDENGFKEMFYPKVHGTWVLDKLTREDKLDFFIMCSSAITLVGGAGVGEYMAANCYQDAYTGYRARSGCRTLTINWPRWKENGKSRDDRDMFTGISSDEALKAFDKVLSKDTGKIAVGKINYKSSVFLFEEHMPFKLSPAIREKLDSVEKNDASIAIEKTKSPVIVTGKNNSDYTEAQLLLAQIWGEELGLNEINIYDNFFELGGDSIYAMKIIGSFNKRAGCQIDVTDLLRFPTVNELSGHLEKEGVVAAENTVKLPTIPCAPLQEYYPLSSAQKRLYIINQFSDTGVSYNMPIIMTAEGKIDLPRLESAFRQIVERHEVLRTSFENIEGGFVQRIHNDVEFRVNYLEAPEEKIEETVRAFIKPFNLGKAPLLRICLVKTGEDKHLMFLDMHHIISDGISLNVLVREFMSLYQGKVLDKLKIQYKDYSVWQNNLFEAGTIEKQEEYWLEVFKDEIPVLELPLDYMRPQIQSFDGSRLRFEIDRQLAVELARVAIDNDATLYMVLLAAYTILLSKCTGQEDIVVGSPIAGRPHADLQDLIGMFVNTLAMRNFPKGEKTFRDYLGEVREHALKAYENQDYQFEELVEKLDIKRDMSRNPVFDTVFVLQNVGKNVLQMEGIKLSPYDIEVNISKFDLSLNAAELNDTVAFELEYNTRLFKKDTIIGFAEYFINILTQITRNVDARLKDIELLSSEERKKLLYAFNATKAEYPRDKTIHELFEEQALSTPENVAVMFRDKQLTYRELNEKANRLARLLRLNGLQQGSIIAVMTERSIEMIIGIIAVLKAGGAYLPIDGTYPSDRINFMLRDSGTQILLHDMDIPENIVFDGMLLNIKETGSYSADASNLQNISNPESLAYVIYTSGSTGKPKGVMVLHKGVANLKAYFADSFDIKEQDSILQFASNSFDASVWEIFMALLAGAALCIAPKEAIENYTLFADYVNKCGITVATLPPPYVSNIHPDSIKTLRMLITAGSSASSDLVERWSRKVRYVNAYGPTETTICATVWKEYGMAPYISIPIGKPINNFKVYIVDKNMKIQPVGVPGELCIAGDGLAKGYLNREELTKEKFIQSPFEEGERIYRTGDLAKWLPDGNIEFLGRIDHQVKIRGFRIEPGEIENQLLKHEGIKETFVCAKEGADGGKYLCAYYVSDNEIAVEELKEHISEELPEYMIPSYFLRLEKLPLTPNGKIDMKSLPEPHGNIDRAAEYAAPLDETEEKLVLIWEELLGMERIGTRDNFFDLGGHSIKAASLNYRIHRDFNVEVPLRQIFQTPTVAQLASYIKSADRSTSSYIQPAEEKDYYQLSSAQKRLYILNQLEDGGISYNIPGIMEVEGKIDITRFENAFKRIVTRHEVFRTYFESIDGEIVQKVHKNLEFHVEYIAADEEKREDLVNNFIRPFDLSKVPLLRVRLVKIEEDRHLMMIDMHHIISDGQSMEILVSEFSRLYEENDLELPRIQYKDFCEWQAGRAGSELIKSQQEYWLAGFSGEIPVLDMPLDFVRPSVQSFEGDRLAFELDGAAAAGLRRLAAVTGTTMYMVLLAAYNVLLSKYTGQEDIVVGSPIAGRSHTDLEAMVGMFVNTLAMRNAPSGEKTFEEFLGEVRKNSLDAYENQDYQFEELVEKLDLKRDLSRNALFDTMFVLQNTENTDLKMGQLRVTPLNFDFKKSKFDMTLKAAEKDKKIFFELEYCTRLFKRETISRLAGHLKNILEAVVREPLLKISEIDMLAPLEKEEIVNVFNNTYKEGPIDTSIYELFEKQAERTPDITAVVFEGQMLTYGELNQKAKNLAGHLTEKGVGHDSIVGIITERSLEMIIAVFGILRAGAGYLPIDPSYPGDRISYMLEDSNVKILLTQQKLMDKVDFDGVILPVEDTVKSYCASDVLTNTPKPDGLAYVIYTSGSTGKPKGVAVENASVCNLVLGLYEEIYRHYDSRLNIAMVSPYVFDASVKQIFPALLLGHTLHIVPEQARFEGNRLLEFYDKHEIDISDGTPIHLGLIANSQGEMAGSIGVKHFIIGGEELSRTVLEEAFTKLDKPGLKITNVYGPTECCDVTTTYTVSRENYGNLQLIPIGRPIQNARVYIMDKYHNIVPKGIAGELYISGKGLSRGYLNNKELTDEKFIANPFEHDCKMYRTGDRARWSSDGNIEYLGRIDQQVKIRGFRIEPGEIENRLIGHETVREAVVTAREDKDGVRYLCAYITADRQLTVAELRGHLAEDLPEYMIPSYFVQLESMPLSSNGKIDRKKLPEPDFNVTSAKTYEAPVTKTEKALAEIWCDILNIEKSGIKDNFFELGGHSLRATVLVSKIYKVLDVNVPLRDIFKYPTIKELANYIEGCAKSRYSSILPVEKREYYPASPAQKRIYVLSGLEEESRSYNMPEVLILEGPIDNDRLRESFKALIARHDAMRTSFELKDGEVIQVVHDKADFDVDFAEINEDKLEEAVQGLIRPFDLSQAPLIRVCLMKLSDKKHALFIDTHHIISDGVSCEIIVKELVTIYKNGTLADLRIQYKDFSEWQNRFFKSDLAKEQERYWLSQFEGEIPSLDLPLDYKRPLLQSFEGDSLGFSLEPELTEKLKVLAASNGCTVFMVLLAAYTALLFRYTGQEDIAVGSPVAGRPHADLEGLVGMFVNTLVMRNYPKGEMSFIQFLGEVRDNSIKALENQDYQFEELVERLDIKRDISRNPLFDTMLVLQNTDGREIELEGLKIYPYEYKNNISKFDLTLNAAEAGDSMAFSLAYSVRLFKRETIERLAKHFINLLAFIVNEPERRLCDIDMLTEEEKSLLHQFNNTKCGYPKDKTIDMLFEEQVKKTPDKTAVVCGNEMLTYLEIDRKANLLANILKGKGVLPDEPVGLITEKSFEMVIGTIAILKAGGAYLPVDPKYPEDRKKYIIEDSSIKTVLIQSSLNKQLDFGYDGQIILIDNKKLDSDTVFEACSANSPESLAYVMYTSGSTGKPKGVMVEHRNVVRLVKNTNYVDFNEDDNILQTGAIVFDASTFEVWGALLNGMTLYLADEDTVLSPLNLRTAIKENKITTMWLTSPLFNQLSQADPSIFEGVRNLLVGGDILSPRHINSVRKVCTGINIINGYGPTENTTFSTTFLIDKNYEDNIPIGKPINNSTAYILDKYGNLLPVGVPGELVVGGDGVARGYFRRPELTDDKFADDPFTHGGRIYRTGDRARWLPDGNIEFLGRMDNQVKIRGFRIEPGEIENHLLNMEEINQAIVIAKVVTSSEKMLCVYFTANKEITGAEIRLRLKERLPDYMIPSYFIKLDSMPLNKNGKLDTQALPKPEGLMPETEYTAPQNMTEDKLAVLWQEILGVERVGANDNFFELGGHSLRATELISMIHREFDVQLPLSAIFTARTLRDLAIHIRTAEKSGHSQIMPVGERNHYELSSAQKRLYVLNQLEEGQLSYNMPSILFIEGKIEVEKFSKAFRALVQRHEALRTCFRSVEERPVQVVEDKSFLEIEYTELCGIEGHEEECRELDSIVKAFIRPFDLCKAPLLRVGLVKLADDRHLLLYDTHHIISDGTSEGILLRDFAYLYMDRELPEIRIHYKDFSEWQNQLFKSEEIKKQEQYWLQRYSGTIPVLRMPTDYPRPLTQSFEGERLSFEADLSLTAEMNRIAFDAGATLYMVLLSAFNILLYKYTGQEDIVVGSAVAGRQHTDLLNVIGMFVNMLAMRNNPKSDITFMNFLRNVRENALQAYENQDYQFEELVDRLKIERDPGRNPIFDVVFSLQNMKTYNVDFGDLKFTPYSSGPGNTKFDITLFACETEGGLTFYIEYCSRLFKNETMETFSKHYIKILEQIAENKDILIKDIQLVDETEKNVILSDIKREREKINIDLDF